MPGSVPPVRKDRFVVPLGDSFEIRVDGGNFGPEHALAVHSFQRLSESEKVAVKLRYGGDVFRWWRESGKCM